MKSEILDFGIRNSVEESGILLTIGVRNPSSIDNESEIHSVWNPKSSQSKFFLDCLTRGDQGDGKDKLYCSVADPWGGGGRGALLLLIIRPKWGPKGQKQFFWRPGPPPPLSKGLDDRPPTPLSQGLDPALLFPSYYKFCHALWHKTCHYLISKSGSHFRGCLSKPNLIQFQVS